MTKLSEAAFIKEQGLRWRKAEIAARASVMQDRRFVGMDKVRHLATQAATFKACGYDGTSSADAELTRMCQRSRSGNLEIDNLVETAVKRARGELRDDVG